VAQGDDYLRNTLCKRKRQNEPYEACLIDFGWACAMSPALVEGTMFDQLVGFFVEFAHKNYPHANAAGKDMIIRALDILGSGRKIMVFASDMTLKGALVPDWKYIRVWTRAYPATDNDFVSQRGSNCKPKANFQPLEPLQMIKRKLLRLAEEGGKRRRV